MSPIKYTCLCSLQMFISYLFSGCMSQFARARAMLMSLEKVGDGVHVSCMHMFDDMS